MKAADALVAWTPADYLDSPTRGQVKVGPLITNPDNDWTMDYAYTGGAAHAERRSMLGDQQVARTFIEFNTLVVRDGIPVEAAHRAFLAIDEYAHFISPDIDGAREHREIE